VVCADDGLAADAAAPLLRAQMREAGPPWSSTLNTPTSQWYQGGKQKPQVMELPTPVSLNSSCMRVDGGSVTVDGPGMLYTSRDGTTWSSPGVTTEYYQAVGVAFGCARTSSEPTSTFYSGIPTGMHGATGIKFGPT
jgi:hypothetical protein